MSAPKATEMAPSMDAIYAQYYKSVFLICLRMTRNYADAEDLAHDTFIHVNNGLNNFRADAEMSTWICRIAVNTVLMKFRKQSTRLEKITATGDMSEEILLSLHHPYTDEAVIDIRHIIEQLPPGYRKALELHEIMGYDHAEAGERMGVTAGTSKSQLHKARIVLRRMMRGEGLKGKRKKALQPAEVY